LERDLDATISFWWGLVEKEKELSRIPLPPEERTAHLPTLIRDVIVRLRLPRSAKAAISHAACDHGTLRRKQGYTVAMLVEESRILQVSIFHTLNNNLRTVDFSKLLLDVITIADEVDSQLKQAALCYVEPKALRVVAQGVKTHGSRIGRHKSLAASHAVQQYNCAYNRKSGQSEK
jgi:hypothetical protein